MKKMTTSLAVGLFSVVVSGCGGGGGNPAGGGSGGSSGTCSMLSFSATEANDYKFASTLTLTPTTVKPKTDLMFEWGSITHDFIQHRLDVKADVDQMLMMLWKLNLTDLQTKLNTDDEEHRLSGTDLVGGAPLTYPADGSTTKANLFSFKVGSGQPVEEATILARLDPDRYPPANYTYTLMAATGLDPGQGVRMIQAFKLDPASSNTTVKIDDNSTAMQYTADLHSLQPVMVSAGQAAIKLDWGSIKTNALGFAFDPSNITEAILGHYTQSPKELESKFLDLELIATELYRTEIASGTSVDFSTMKTTAGTSFTGITSSGTWIVALHCGSSNCRNPAPWYLTVLKPCS
ncbi:MAG: hypothetical protein ABJA82_08045 [Myxococcales bacterium]